MIHDSHESYGDVSKVFHWLMGILIVWQMLKFFDRIDEGEHWVGQTLVQGHFSIGTLLLVLIILRMLWAARQRTQRPRQNPSTAFLVKLGHGLLYTVMLLLPITGILAMYGGGHGLTAFGVEIFPEGPEIAWAATLGGLHSPLAWILLVMVLGHIVIALGHHFIVRDDTLRRML